MNDRQQPAHHNNAIASSKSFQSELCHCYKNSAYAGQFQESRRRAKQKQHKFMQDLPEEEFDRSLPSSRSQPTMMQQQQERVTHQRQASSPSRKLESGRWRIGGFFGRMFRSKSADNGGNIKGNNSNNSNNKMSIMATVLESEAPTASSNGGANAADRVCEIGPEQSVSRREPISDLAQESPAVALRRQSPTISNEAKRLSLPATRDRLRGNSPPEKATLLTSLMTLSKRDRRSSLADIGFGKSSTYRKLERLGQGTYATVYRGKSLLTDSPVALKEIRLEHDEGAPCTAIREVSLLRDLKHANIVTLHDVIHTEKSLTLVFEYLDKDLKQYLEDCNGLLHEDNVRLYLYQLVRGLEFCHRRRCLHRDLKPQNILLSTRGDLKLADFGLARANSVPSKNYSNEVCTLWYRPPDVLTGCTEYGTHIDLWGVGTIFFEMLTGRPMFPGATVEEQLQLIFNTLGTPNEDIWPGSSIHPQLKAWASGPTLPSCDLKSLAPRIDSHGRDLMRQLLRYRAESRIPAGGAKVHAYFSLHLPGKLNDLPDTATIFDIPGISLKQNPGSSSSNTSNGTLHDTRRQSLSL